MSILVVPSRRLRGLGAISRLGAVADEDSKLLIAASTDDLITLARCLSAFRSIVSQRMGGLIGEFKIAFDALDAMRAALAAVGLAPDQSTLNAAQARNELLKTSGEGAKYMGEIDAFLGGIANILVTRKPEWQIGYTSYNDGALTTVVSRNAPDDLEQVDLDFRGGFVEAASFIYKNRDVLERVKQGKGMGAAGALLVIIIVIVLGLTALIFLITGQMALSKSVETKRLEETLRRNTEQIAFNNNTINRDTNELTQLLATHPSERTAADNARIAALQNEVAKLQAENRGLDAQNVQVELGLDKVRGAQNLLDQLGSTLSSAWKYVAYGGAAIVLTGIAWVVWKTI